MSRNGFAVFAFFAIVIFVPYFLDSLVKTRFEEVPAL